MMGGGWDDRDRGFAGSMSRGGFSAVVRVNARVGGCGVNVLPSKSQCTAMPLR